ncbi:hypothetical protein [Chryseobacterium sp. Mn2064]|uniref:hypothetical protein n=1 Tax=Chryseobacterium sp. Mn2064 TaxID=3395263 RepID=UPI003BBB3EBE
MNKNYFDSYLCTIMAPVSVQKEVSAHCGLSLHNSISQNMCFDMMCNMMMF